jgi:hypothetical protein
MNWLVYHTASRHAFFTGIGLVILAGLVSSQNKPIANRIAVWAFLIGAVAITISSGATRLGTVLK